MLEAVPRSFVAESEGIRGQFGNGNCYGNRLLEVNPLDAQGYASAIHSRFGGDSWLVRE